MGWITKFISVLTLLNTASSSTENDAPKNCDFIVVGSGAGGATVAARLSEVSEVTVCLFEAGIKDTQGQYASTVHIPRLWASLIPGDYTWNTTTVPQSGLNGRTISNGMGKGLGGSTTHNGMAYFRGFKADYDYWEEKGAIGWNYKSVLPYFLKSENMTIDELKTSSFHSADGPFTLTQDPTAFNTPLGKTWKRTAEQLSIPVVDCNGPTPFGLCVLQASIRNGRRESTSTAFLNPGIGRRNLFVVTEALVSRILIYRKKAYGIRYIKHGRTYTVRAKREIIVSGGTFESPKLLQLSGIGPKHVLQKLKVRPHAFLPVGGNFQDHMSFLVDIESSHQTVTLEDLKDPNNMAEYLFKSSGLWASNRMPLNVYSDIVKQKHNWPEIQYIVIDGLFEDTPLANDIQMGRFPERPSDYRKKRKGYTLLVFLSHPKSRGIVRARSSNAADTPIIDPRYLSEQDDIETFVKGPRESLAVTMNTAINENAFINLKKGIKACWKFTCVPYIALYLSNGYMSLAYPWGIRSIQRILKNSAAMRKVKARLTFRPPAEKCNTITVRDSDEFWKCVLRQQANVGYHAVRSCPMGAPNDKWAVVDPKLRVYGIENLRVVDASVMPEISSGNTMAPTIMIGEHAADIIKKDHNLGKVYGIENLRVVDASVMPEISSGNTMAPTIMIGEHAADIIKKDHNLGKY